MGIVEASDWSENSPQEVSVVSSCGIYPGRTVRFTTGFTEDVLLLAIETGTLIRKQL